MDEFLTVKQLSEKLSSGETTSEEIVTASLKRIQEQNGALNAFLSVADDALDQARASDKRRADGEDLGPLAGIPVALKDNMLVQGWGNTSASQILDGHTSAYDGAMAERLKAAGAVLIGRTNMDEFAMGSSTESSHFGETKNPWDLTKIPGGSSGGSAVAVSAGLVPVALGSDTGGSIRQPASLCGVTGLKPTYGRVSRYGIMALASSLDQIGPFTRTVEDAALVMQAIEGRDERDATSIELPDTTIPELLEKDLNGVKLGLPKEYFAEGLDPEIKRCVMDAVAILESAGAEVLEVSLPHAEYGLAAYYIIQPAEASSNLGRFDGLRYGYHSSGDGLQETYERTRGEGFGAEVKRRIMIGSYVLSAGYVDAFYHKALKVRRLIKQDFDEALKTVDAIVTPTSPSVAWGLHEKFNDPIAMYLADIYTVTANLATVPGLSIPCGFVKDLPVGLQIMGRPFDEHMLYRIGHQYQTRTDWHTRMPQV
ncbi:Asp-tRNA(Asn)/Glu-tRNA(Gln) amidotransferase GatCAB subunit A [Candidatus Uhrbacteria bacterium CG_4_9_14_3_um_filter_50_9]|uniref:Glutamyl-tRNA(Gln) amidotransferase subunit A n=1 Tax=Candidatus Uhrbacteria bacterium CG_4_9_14_3_um_filter_50_9 TaxID=1975035 RepID=A0A2M7XE09_9BACT|nr:MAG: Asp-tRNA(Asn)/Glu-tRNA(Gln) amidotransferase GatCAB subunit A [Candidatus Uhrbacteria bacterium CG_4_9_14_3_um_filter_50_9]